MNIISLVQVNFPAGRDFRKLSYNIFKHIQVSPVIANCLYFDIQEQPNCPLAKQTVHGRILWRRNPLLTETWEGRLS